MISLPPRIDVLDPCAARFVFREVRSAAELREVLAMRYRVYKGAPDLAHFPSLDDASRLDADAYDLTSRHFGLFAHVGGRESVVGTLRITSERPSPQLGLLRAVCAAQPSLLAHVGADRSAPLPMLSYLTQAPAVRERYEFLIASGAKVAEPGRLAVAPELRMAAGRKGLRLSHFIVECALAFGWQIDGLDHVFLDCNVALESFYSRFGFEPVVGVGAAFQPGLGFEVTVLQATPNSLPAATRGRVAELAGQFHAAGEAGLDMRGPSSERHIGESREVSGDVAAA